MTNGQRKTELYCLVAELRAHRWTASAIADELGLTLRRVQQVIADLTEPPTPRSELPALLLERLCHFAKRNEISTRNCETQ